MFQLNFNPTFDIVYRPLFRENDTVNFTYIYRINAINNFNTENTVLHFQLRRNPEEDEEEQEDVLK
jgi:hypothetical protein